jgi:hypothetical protein
VSRQANKSDQPGEFSKFTNLLDKLLSVPHSKIKAELDAEKAAKRTRPKRVSSRHASGEKD